MANLSFTFITRLDDNRIRLVERISGLKFTEAMRRILNEGNVSLVMSKFLERVIDDWVEKSGPKQVRQKPKRKEVKPGKSKQSEKRR